MNTQVVTVEGEARHSISVWLAVLASVSLTIGLGCAVYALATGAPKTVAFLAMGVGSILLSVSIGTHRPSRRMR